MTDKKATVAWLRFLTLFLVIFSILAVGLFLKNRQAYKKVKMTQDSLEYYKKLYYDLKKDYALLESKYNLALRSALEGTKLIAEKQQQLIELQRVLTKQDSILRSVKQALKEVLVGYDNTMLKIEQKNGRLYITMRNKLLFPSGSDKVEAQGTHALGLLARVLNKNKNLKIIIEGHTDNVPVKARTKCWKDNWDLSAARAISVARILIDKYGVNPQNIEIAGKAEYDPVAPNMTAKGRAFNRRIEIIVTPDLSELYKILNEEQ